MFEIFYIYDKIVSEIPSLFYYLKTDFKIDMVIRLEVIR